MSFITLLAISALCMIGVLHLYWAFGGTKGIDIALPTRNGERLINPGRTLTAWVGLMLFGFAFVAYSLFFDDLSSSCCRDYCIVGGWIISAIFTLRGIGEFNAVGMFKKIKSSEFAYYDTRLYTPFALSMGVIFAVLAYRAS